MRKMRISVVLLLTYLILLNLIFNPSVDAKTLENNVDCTYAKNFIRTYHQKVNISRSTNQYDDSICGGKCCNRHEESMIYEKADEKMKNLIKYQLKTLRDIWETSFITYKDRLLDLVSHSENRTLHLFFTVYQRMFPLTKQPITELYQSIRSHITTKPSQEYRLEPAIDIFFKNLFPIAYHNAVESHDVEELSADYKSCLRKNYEYLKPFGDIPQTTSRILGQYIGLSNIFLRALDEGGKIVSEIEKFANENLSTSCQKALFKMDYCGACKGYADSKPCHSYCSNVLSGCLTFFLNGLENNWSSFVETMENLVASRNKETVDKTIRTLDGKLSEAIMYAMTNGPDLEKKVSNACGNNHGSKQNRQEPQSFTGESIETITSGSPKSQPNNLKWSSAPPDSEILQLLSNLDRYKKFALQVANQYCGDESYDRDDMHCWNGDFVGKYTLQIVDIYSQKYNPEIPEFQNLNENKHFNELNDRILSSRNSINKEMASLTKFESDKMLSDMASQYDNEGSANDYDLDLDDMDDTDDDSSGSGDNQVIPITPDVVDTSISIRKATTSSSSVLRESSSYISILSLALLFISF